MVECELALKCFKMWVRMGSLECRTVTCTKTSKSKIDRLWHTCCQACHGLFGLYAYMVDTVMHCSSGAGAGADHVRECRNAGELSVQAWAGCIWKEDHALGSDTLNFP